MLIMPPRLPRHFQKVRDQLVHSVLTIYTYSHWSFLSILHLTHLIFLLQRPGSDGEGSIPIGSYPSRA